MGAVSFDLRYLPAALRNEISRFFLHVSNETRAVDPEGVELPNLDAARTSAVRGARELIAEAILAGRSVSRRHCIEITDGDGTLHHTERFGDLVETRP